MVEGGGFFSGNGTRQLGHSGVPGENAAPQLPQRPVCFEPSILLMELSYRF
jgi:hypothetical protein